MKKIFAILLAVMMLASMATVASAASTTTLTTTVPAASYTLNIPADQKIPFGQEITNLGLITVSDSSGFATGKNLQVTVNYDAFMCKEVSTQIPFYLSAETENLSWDVAIRSGDAIVFKGQTNGTVRGIATFRQEGNNGWYAMRSFNLIVNSEDWGKALAGDYTSTITFTAEVVAE